jgi:hypothetical protein
LTANRGVCMQGFKILGIGFTMDPEAAHALIDKDRRNLDVLFPYLNGQDLSSRPDFTAGRWVINFHDWGQEKARTYPECYRQVEALVKPARAHDKVPSRRDRWWQYSEYRRYLIHAIAPLERVIVITLHTKIGMPVMVPAGQVFSHALGVFATDDTAILGLLSGELHYWWAATWGSSLGTTIRYTPSDVFETFPLPELTAELRALGDRLDRYRRDVMLSRQAGLTDTYNLVFDPVCKDEDIVELRRIHRDLDEAVCHAYGWDDLIEHGLDHGFHKAGVYTRYTFGPTVQREVLDRLLELNHARYAEEVAQGLHNKKAGRKTKAAEGTLF